MVTSAHEASHRIFQDRPEILAPVFAVLGIPLPEKMTVDALISDVTEIRPLERRVDTVVRITPSDGDAFVLAVEAQQRRDKAKGSSWAYYVAYLRAKYDLPVLLLVVCQDRATAKWAVGPFACEARGWTAQRTYPLVVGPDNLPVITDERTAAENLTMAVFSAVAHGRNPRIEAILEALARALQRTDGKSSDYFNDFLDNSLGKTPAGEKWREILSFVSYFPGRGTVRETAYLEGKAEGKAQGEVKGILSVLEVRDIPVSDSVRERITSCTDLDRLDAWLERSRTVALAEDLFAGDPEVPEVPEVPEMAEPDPS